MMFNLAIAVTLCLISSSAIEVQSLKEAASCDAMPNDLISFFEVSEVVGKDNIIASLPIRGSSNGKEISLTGSSNYVGGDVAEKGGQGNDRLISVTDSVLNVIGSNKVIPVSKTKGLAVNVVGSSNKIGYENEMPVSIVARGSSNIVPMRYSTLTLVGSSNEAGEKSACEASKYDTCPVTLTLKRKEGSQENVNSQKQDNVDFRGNVEIQQSIVYGESNIIFENLKVLMCKPKECGSNIREQLVNVPGLLNKKLLKADCEKNGPCVLHVDVCGEKLSPIELTDKIGSGTSGGSNGEDGKKKPTSTVPSKTTVSPKATKSENKTETGNPSKAPKEKGNSTTKENSTTKGNSTTLAPSTPGSTTVKPTPLSTTVKPTPSPNTTTNVTEKPTSLAAGNELVFLNVVYTFAFALLGLLYW